MKMKKLFALLLAVCMIAALAACAPADEENNGPVTYVDPYAQYADDYDKLSQEIYKDVLGEFNTYYTQAKAATSVAERYALMAIAEAKLLEAGVFLPLTSQGGNYAISRVAPYTAPNVLWGNDSDRFHNVVVADKPITPADRDTMKAKWNELKGTGTYEAWAESFLVEKGYALKDSYTLGYSSDPQTWDVLATYRAADSEAIVNTYDNLMEYDCEGTLKPALATGYTVSDDGLTYTFTLRPGLKWVDSQGREVADVKADDFVAGLQHLLDAQGGLEGLTFGLIKNAQEYYAGTVTDFKEVGVEAIDDLTVQYTLCEPTPYFMTMHGYGMFCPMSRSFYESKGGKFGAEFNAEAETYVYGKNPESIAYCGPYIVTNATEKNTIVFKANEKYWNKDNINMKTITWLYNDGEDALKAYNDCMAGTLDGAGLNASAVAAAKADGNFDKLAYTSGTDATAFCGFVNVNRTAMANYTDNTTAASPKTAEQAARAKGALYNVHFRRAMLFALDRGAHNAQTVGEDLKYASVINSYTPGNFVNLPEDVTVKINGTDKTYAAGTYYGQIMQDQIDADGVKIKVWDPTAEAGAGSSAGFDGWYSVENAKAEMAMAVEELKAQGLEISKENPIYIDLPMFTGSETYKNRAQAFKQSVEASLDGMIIFNLTECPKSGDWYDAAYYPETGADMNYDIADVSGWGPDWGDPNSYLDTMLGDYMGSMAKNLGIF